MKRSAMCVALLAASCSVDEEAERSRAKVRQVGRVIEAYREQNGAYPASLQILLTERLVPHRTSLQDHFGREFVYRVEADGGITLYSAGRNGRDEGGSGDDVR